MQQRISPARNAGRTVATLLAVALALGAAPAALAQTPAPKPAEKKAAPAKPAAKPAQAQPAPAQPAQAPVPNGQAAAAQQATNPKLTFSPWIKVCNKQSQASAKTICVMTKTGQLASGQPIVHLELIEPEGSDKKLFRVYVPLGVQLKHGTRMFIDEGTPVTAPFGTCLPSGCLSDYEFTKDNVAKLKKGKIITVQAVNLFNTVTTMPVPLADFAKAYDGPPTDMKALEEQHRKAEEERRKTEEQRRKQHDELLKKAEQARKRAEEQPAAPAPAPPKQ